MKPFLKFLSSLELTIACLALSIVLIFFGTLDQTNLGIHGATEKYFYTFFVYQPIPSLDISVPYLPGGYLIGFTLMFNLLTSAFYRFRFSVKKLGIWLTHIGVILLLLGEFISSVYQEESSMTIDEGQTVDFIESFREPELALMDTSAAETNRVYAIPEMMLEREQKVDIDELPFYLTIEQYMPNSVLQRRDQGVVPGLKLASTGHGTDWFATSIPETGKTEERNMPSMLVTVFEKKPSTASAPQVLGTWLVSELLPAQDFMYQNKRYTMEIRRKREYVPYDITLLDFKHEKYRGTNKAKNFQSDVIVRSKSSGIEREFKIFMNNPLRYEDLTFYQQSFLPNETTTILQVVRNPGRWLPYISCTLVSLGLLYQFLISLAKFTNKRKAQP